MIKPTLDVRSRDACIRVRGQNQSRVAARGNKVFTRAPLGKRPLFDHYYRDRAADLAVRHQGTLAADIWDRSGVR